MCRHSLLVPLVVGALTAAGCTEAKKSRNPLSPDVAGPIAGVSIAAPAPLEPANGESVDAGEPITLAFQNATTNGERPLRQHLQLASDAQFSELIVNLDKLPVGEEGQTQYRVPQELPANTTYYWRVRGLDGANTGSFSATASFEVVEPVVIEPPVPATPIGGAPTTSTAPVLIANNGAVSGPAGQVSYRFEVAKDAEFASMEAVVTVPRAEGAQTQAPLGDVGPGRQLFWRVQALSGNGQSGYSAVESFRTPAAAPAPAPPPPSADPPPTSPAPPPATDPPPTSAPPPSGGGGRAPDPPPGGRLEVPGYGPGVVVQVARARPDLLAGSCQDDRGGAGWLFLDAVVDRLRQFDTRWGYNCKRGNCGDPSQDVVTYHGGRGPTVEGNRDVWVIDVLTGHCGPSPSPGWLVHGYGGASGWTSRGRF